MPNAWKPLGAAAPRKLGKVYLQPYQAAQWLARFARGYLAPVEDDSHTSLEWRRDLHMMVTNEADAGGRRVAMGLDPRDLVLVFLIDGRAETALALHSLTDAAAGAWVRAGVRDLGLAPEALDAPSPYELPPSPYAEGAPYDSHKDVAALAEGARYLDNAAMLLADLVETHRDVKPGSAPVRLWPHHFDLATIITLEEGPFEMARAVGAGLAVPDKLYKEFYFYTYPWPREPRKGLPKLRANCSYQYDGFFGAVQTMSRLVKEKDQEAAARAFFTETVGVFMALLHKEMRAG